MPNNQVGFWIRDAAALYASKREGFGEAVGMNDGVNCSHHRQDANFSR